MATAAQQTATLTSGTTSHIAGRMNNTPIAAPTSRIALDSRNERVAKIHAQSAAPNHEIETA